MSEQAQNKQDGRARRGATGGAKRTRKPRASTKAPDSATAPDTKPGPEGKEADRVAAAVGGGEAIGPPGSVGGIDPLRLFGGLFDLFDPFKLAAESTRLMGAWTEVALGVSDVEVAKDKRFADPAWSENPFFRRLAQTYLSWSDSVERLTNTPELEADWRRQAQARYTGSLITSMLAPTNFFWSNPAALKRAFDTGGASVLHGAGNLIHDVVENNGLPTQVDTRPFEVGENLAATPGAVVYRDEMFEVLQYTPATTRVRERPLLMIPPQINKHYFLDLAPGRSFVEYLVGEGVHYFTIVWRNPRDEHGHWGIEDYVQAQLRALDVVAEVSGSESVNVLGACAGGLTSALMLAYLAAKGDDRVSSATFAIAMVDTSFPNALRLMADERLLERIKSDAARGTIYDKKLLAANFAWMRPDDLVFNYLTNNWLLGNDPPAFDILAWNADATNLVAKFDADMLSIYADNAAATPGAVTLLDTPLDLGKITCDNFIVAGETDHITPWMPCYMTSQLLSGPSEVIVTSTGHIQTMVNPPGKPRARYCAGPEPGPDPQAWRAEATEETGSWWPRYAEWLLARSGAERAAPKKLGSRTHPAAEPAPGTYVYE
jgi:poly[(R)-3-hydroxyalkanoate] polymerase subunit PhaC